MMRPNIKIAIAYGSVEMSRLAVALKDTLLTYKEHGYPITVSMVKDDIKDIRENPRIGEDHTVHDANIQERMESYFSDFDIAFFLFDKKGIADIEIEQEDGSAGIKKDCPTLSLNLLYEYGLASSIFINNEMKYLYCFAPNRSNIQDSLEYVKNIGILYLNEIFPGCDYSSIAQQIVKKYVHNILVKTNGGEEYRGIRSMFYEMDNDLPEIGTDIALRNPMEFTSNNLYWADLTQLKPSGVRVSFATDRKGADSQLTDVESNNLALYFEKEYSRFENKLTIDEIELSRRLLYIVDRAVFIMYLRKDSEWDKKAELLATIRKSMLTKEHPEIGLDLTHIYDNDYYLKAIKALRGVFLYQASTQNKTLFNRIDEIISMLEPIVDLSSGIGNRMVYCMAADYLALCYHKRALKNLGKIFGSEREFYLDNPEDLENLHNYISAHKNDDDLVEVAELFIKGAQLFSDVVNCQTNLQKINRGKYIWTSYALYNQARCEFMVYLLNSIFVAVGKTAPKKITVLLEKANCWEDDMKSSINSRESDVSLFGREDKFPKVLVFFLKAEHYHALFEYSLSCMVAQHFDGSFSPKHQVDSSNFNSWKQANLTISDVLNLSDKSVRIRDLKQSFDKELFNAETREAIARLHASKDIPEEIKEAIVKILREANSASLQANDTKKKEAKQNMKALGEIAAKALAGLKDLASILSFFGLTPR